MNTASFIENFPYLANAPTGTDKLRELVLSLAMQGALSEQRENDTPVSDLIESIEGEKKQLVESRAIRKSPKPLPIGAMEIRHPIPDEWLWVRFGTIAQHNAGKTLDRRRNTGTPRDYITTSNLYWGRFDLRELRQMLIRDEELERCTARKGDLLICEGGEAGRAAVWDSDKEVSFQNHVHRARFYGGIDPTFVFRFLQKLSYTGEINEYRKGVGISNMSGKALASIVLPLPPLEEQKRIVARVDELMALCDKLEAQQQERQNLFSLLSRACNTSFADSPTPASLKRLFDDIGKLIAPDLRELVLTLAIHGCLSKPVKGAKNKAKEGGIRPFPIPIDWEWRLLESVTSIKHGHAFKSDYFTDQPQEHVLTTPGNFFESGGFRDRGRKTKYYTGPVPDEFVLEAGDLIIPMTEQAAGLLGSPAFIPDDGKIYLHNQRLGKITPKSETITRNYLACFFNSSFFRQRVGETASGMKVRHTSPKKILQIPVPVPPHAEQQNIVARVETLTALVDRLEAQQYECDELAESFAKFTVAAITGAPTQESDPMKAPKTQLITKLKTETKPKAGSDAPLAKLLAKQKGSVSAKTLWKQSGLEIDAFYQQLKTEMLQGWIVELEKAVMQEVGAN